MQMNKLFTIYSVFFLIQLFVLSDLSANDIVLLNKTKPGTGATEEQADKLFASFLSAMKGIEGLEVRTQSSCEKPCDAPTHIISSELRLEEPYITVYFRIIDRKKGLAANVRRLRLKDAKLQDVINILTSEYVSNFFDFLDRGAYSGTKVIED